MLQLSKLFGWPQVRSLLIAPVLAGAIVLGDSAVSGVFGYWLVILAAIPFLAFAVYQAMSSKDARLRVALLLVGLTLALPAAQLYRWEELPTSLRSVHTAWQVDWVTVFGQERPRTWSLAPDATLRSLFAFLPPLAVFLYVLSLDAAGRRFLHHLLVLMFVGSAVMGILQATLAPQLLADWHGRLSNQRVRVFFANPNHYALLLVFGVALAGGGLIGAIRRMLRDAEMARHGPTVILWAMALLLPLTAIMLTLSRSGVLLAVLLLVALLAITLFGIARDTAGTRRWFAGFAVFGAVVAIQMGFWGVMERFQADPFDDARVYVQRITLEAANEAFPWGTGMGTFRRVYEQHETLETALPLYINRAHNDWIEFYLEAGLAGLVLIGLWLAWWLWARREPAGSDLPIEQRLQALACTLALIALALHCMVDFPMRTVAISTIAGALLALSVPSGGQPLPIDSPVLRQSSRRSRRREADTATA